MGSFEYRGQPAHRCNRYTRRVYEVDVKTAIRKIRSGKLVIIPAESVLTLESLFEQITDENRHEEIETGRPVGYEVW